MFLIFFFFFLLMENLGAMAYSRYTGFCEIMDRDVLELHCIIIWQCDPVKFCHEEFGIEKLLIIINIMMVINLIIMVVSLR